MALLVLQCHIRPTQTKCSTHRHHHLPPLPNFIIRPHITQSPEHSNRSVVQALPPAHLINLLLVFITFHLITFPCFHKTTRQCPKDYIELIRRLILITMNLTPVEGVNLVQCRRSMRSATTMLPTTLSILYLNN